jgi:hypothetical protein
MSVAPQRVPVPTAAYPSDHSCCVTCLDAACESCIRQCSTCDFTVLTRSLACQRLYLKAQSVSLVQAFACSVRCAACQCVSLITSPMLLLASCHIFTARTALSTSCSGRMLRQTMYTCAYLLCSLVLQLQPVYPANTPSPPLPC